MTDNELQLVRDRYREIQSEKELLQETMGLILELEKDPNVQKYLSLTKMIVGQENIDTDKKMMSIFMNVLRDTKNSNGILFDFGVQEIYTGEENCFQEPIKVKHHIYQDIETNKIYYKGYNQILPGDPTWVFNTSDRLADMELEYRFIQKHFFDNIIERPQEEVVEELFGYSKRLVKGK